MAVMAQPSISVEDTAEVAALVVTGRLVTDAVGTVERRFDEVKIARSAARLDLSRLEALDTAGASLIVGLKARLAAEGTTLEFTGLSPARARLIAAVEEARARQHVPPAPERRPLDWVRRLGARVVAGVSDMGAFLSFLGLVVSRLVTTLLHPGRLRLAALFSQMQQTGYNALPIVALMGFLIGIVLAYQGAAQLRQFGAEVFVVDLIAVSVLRELGILLTAIIVAGRSGSAYAAAIGSMKVNEEIDAMRTLGLDPVEVLVLPRVLALVLMLPLLALVANWAALIGGALMSWIELGISPNMFVTRLRDTTDVWHLAVGMIKAPVFAFIIALVGCWQGLQVAASADSVGERTRTSVVQAIFLVIVMDAIFSIFFAEIGL